MTADAQPATQKKASYFLRHWRGELSLPRSYWLNGVLIFGFGVNILLLIIEVASIVLLRSSPPILIAILVGVIALDLAAYVWALVGTWRSAVRYTGPRFWSILARIAIVVGVAISVSRVLNDYHVITLLLSPVTAQ